MADEKKTVKAAAEKATAEVKKVAEKASADTKKAAEKATADTKKATAEVKKAAAETKKAAEKAAADTKKAAEKAAADTKKAAEKATKKAVAAVKKEAVRTAILQYDGEDYKVDEIMAKAEAAFKAENKRKAISEIKVYIKPQDHAAYYVVNDDFAGRVDL